MNCVNITRMEFKGCYCCHLFAHVKRVNITRMEFKTVTITNIAVAPIKVNAAIIENRLMFYFLYYVIILR